MLRVLRRRGRKRQPACSTGPRRWLVGVV